MSIEQGMEVSGREPNTPVRHLPESLSERFRAKASRREITLLSLVFEGDPSLGLWARPILPTPLGPDSPRQGTSRFLQY